jgi:hypothetical protein
MEGHREYFSMIEKLSGEVTGSSKNPSDPMPESIILPLYPHRVRFID